MALFGSLSEKLSHVFSKLTKHGVLTELEIKNAMREILKEIQSGEFAEEFTNEMKSGCKNFNKLREENANHPIEKTGEEIRSSFVWGINDKIINKSKN